MKPVPRPETFGRNGRPRGEPGIDVPLGRESEHDLWLDLPEQADQFDQALEFDQRRGAVGDERHFVRRKPTNRDIAAWHYGCKRPAPFLLEGANQSLALMRQVPAAVGDEKDGIGIGHGWTGAYATRRDIQDTRSGNVGKERKRPAFSRNWSEFTALWKEMLPVRRARSGEKS